MKRLHDIVCTLCCLLLFSCGQQYEPELTAIDSMADTNPDSAAVLLSKFDTLNVSEGNRMYYYLLRAKVSDHLDQLDATTEEAEQLVTYFEDDGDEHLFQRAVLGQLFRDGEYVNGLFLHTQVPDGGIHHLVAWLVEAFRP